MTGKKKKQENAFAGAADALGMGVDALFEQQGTDYALIPLDMITIKAQIREEFEDAENTLEDLAASIRARGILQPVLLRPAGSDYELIAGERRFRAAQLANLEQIPAVIRNMTDEEAEDAQMAENIHRKNLTQIEEAKKIQRDLDRLGTVDAVLEKYQKSRAWLSKALSLLKLPEQAKRLVTENVSADVEVINTVKTIEKVAPEKAKALVDDLKKTRGKENAREKAQAVKEEVKPSKKPKEPKPEKPPKWLEEQRKQDAAGGKEPENLATPKDRSQEVPGPVTTYSGSQDETPAKQDKPAGLVLTPVEALANAYVNIFEHGSSPKTVLEVMQPEDRDSIEDFLMTFYEAGQKARTGDIGRAVIHGFRNGQFASDSDSAFALIAFLQGTGDTQFSLLDILGSVKA